MYVVVSLEGDHSNQASLTPFEYAPTTHSLPDLPLSPSTHLPAQDKQQAGLCKEQYQKALPTPRYFFALQHFPEPLCPCHKSKSLRIIILREVERIRYKHTW